MGVAINNSRNLLTIDYSFNMRAIEVISAVFTEKNQKLSGKQLYFQHNYHYYLSCKYIIYFNIIIYNILRSN